MNKPVIQDLDDHYKGDGLQPFLMQLEYPSGNAVDLIGSTILMQLKNSLQVIAWEFSSEATGDNKLTILEDGRFQFPRILSWDIPSTKYYFDIQVTADDGNVRTFVKGTWKVNQDSTR